MKNKMKDNLQRSLMLVTALIHISVMKMLQKTAKKAYAENISLKEACVSLGFLTEEQFDRDTTSRKNGLIRGKEELI